MGKRWTVEEDKILCQAWINITSSEEMPKDLEPEVFAARLRKEVEALALASSEVIEERYHHRKAMIISYRFFKVLMAETIRFVAALEKVRSCNPEVVHEDELTSMAIAVHLGLTNTMDYAFTEVTHTSWKVYHAWLMLKEHPSFAPEKLFQKTPSKKLASRRDPMLDVSEVEDSDDDWKPGSVTVKPKFIRPAESSVPGNESRKSLTRGSIGQNKRQKEDDQRASPLAKMSSKKQQLSGPVRSFINPGEEINQQQDHDLQDEVLFKKEYKKSKLENMEQMMAVRKERQEDLKAMASNEALCKTFSMAIEGYKLFRDEDPILARKFKGALQKHSIALLHEAPAVDIDDEEEEEHTAFFAAPATPVSPTTDQHDDVAEQMSHHDDESINGDRWSVDI